MVFIGYEPGSKAYRFFNPRTKRVCISRDSVFMEEHPWDWSDNMDADGFDTFSIGSMTMAGGHGKLPQWCRAMGGHADAVTRDTGRWGSYTTILSHGTSASRPGGTSNTIEW
jgi:hypothetical protein